MTKKQLIEERQDELSDLMTEVFDHMKVYAEAGELEVDSDRLIKTAALLVGAGMQIQTLMFTLGYVSQLDDATEKEEI